MMMQAALRRGYFWLLNLLGLVVPQLMARLVFWHYCQVPARWRGAGDDLPPLLRAAVERLASDYQPITIAHQGRFGGGTVVAYIANPAAGNSVWLLHGWSGRAATMVGLAEKLRQQGRCCVLVDLPGHGRASGSMMHVGLAVQALQAVAKQLGAPDAIIAHSFGGVVANALIAGSIEGFAAMPVKKLVLMAVPQSMRRIFARSGTAFGLGRRQQQALEQMVEKLSGHSIADFDGVVQLAAQELALLILHAPDDAEVSYQSAEEFASLANATLKPMHGLGHRRILYDPASAEQVADFILS